MAQVVINQTHTAAPKAMVTAQVVTNQAPKAMVTAQVETMTVMPRKLNGMPI